MFLQSEISDITIQSLVHVVFVQHLEQQLKKREALIHHQQEQMLMEHQRL